jgi:hypothetical protein
LRNIRLAISTRGIDAPRQLRHAIPGGPQIALGLNAVVLGLKELQL